MSREYAENYPRGTLQAKKSPPNTLSSLYVSEKYMEDPSYQPGFPSGPQTYSRSASSPQHPPRSYAKQKSPTSSFQKSTTHALSPLHVPKRDMEDPSYQPGFPSGPQTYSRSASSPQHPPRSYAKQKSPTPQPKKSPPNTLSPLHVPEKYMEDPSYQPGFPSGPQTHSRSASSPRKSHKHQQTSSLSKKQDQKSVKSLSKSVRTKQTEPKNSFMSGFRKLFGKKDPKN
jgi:hypothetical protein